MSIGLFLSLNGLRLAAGKVDATQTVLALASGKLTEAALASWIDANSEPIA